MLQRYVSMGILMVFVSAAIAADSAQGGGDWPAYGGGAGGTRFSKLKQIDTRNVGRLRVAWTYDTGEGRGDAQTQPIVVNDVLFGVTPTHQIFAVKAASGKVLWKFDSGLPARGPNRGVTYWADGADRRIFAAVQSYLYALDAGSGRPITNFGDGGRIDLREGLGRDASKVTIVLTTPGVVYKDLIITGGRMPEALPAAPGDIRAFDVRTGKLRWAFHTIPRPGEFGYETWPKEAHTYSGAVNNWCGMAVDERLGIVYAPTGSSASDFYGYDRVGNNLFANSLLALDAATGKRIWHFQAVRHDIWDRDFPSPPVLVSLRHNGANVDAVVQTSKQGMVYVFDRKTGQPLFPIRDGSFPESDTPGERTAAHQPIPTAPEPFARQLLTADLLTNRTPEAHAWAVKRFESLRSGGQFVPLSPEKDTVIFPGFDGGAEWGGSAFDPESKILYVNANDIAWTSGLAKNTGGNSGKELYLRNCAVCHGDSRAGAPPQIPALTNIGQKKNTQDVTAIVRQGAGRMPAFPTLKDGEVNAIAAFLVDGENKELSSKEESAVVAPYRFTGYQKFVDTEGYPAVAPPWGTLNAISLETGRYAWKIPLGEYPELAARGMRDTGTENYGGPLVTAGGLLFIGATNFDNKFRAFDKRNGKLLWETTLPAAGNATPVTYESSGKQFVVIYATGGKARPAAKNGGVYVAFALPDKGAR